MRQHKGMRPQDVVVLLKIICLQEEGWQFRDLAAGLFIPLSEISASLKRSAIAGLYQPHTRSVHRQSLLEFLQYGLKYVFPVHPGAMVTGIATAHSHPFYQKHFKAETPYVWPDEKGDVRGLLIEPLHSKVPKAAKGDADLYRLLASIDILRVGRAREVKAATNELSKAIL